jgi:hypothetical protein
VAIAGISIGFNSFGIELNDFAIQLNRARRTWPHRSHEILRTDARFWVKCVRKIISFVRPGSLAKEDSNMLVRLISVALGYLIAWLVVLPALAVLGAAALFLYATLAEITYLLTGTTPRAMDPSTIRLTARRICRGRPIV